MGIGEIVEFEKTLHDFIYEAFDGYWSTLDKIIVTSSFDLGISISHEPFNDNFESSRSNALNTSGFVKYVYNSSKHKVSSFSDFYSYDIKPEYKYIVEGIESIEKHYKTVNGGGTFKGHTRHTFDIKINWKK
jgi:hypothetical protein